MRYSLIVLPLAALLCACQGSNPYRAEAMPWLSAPAPELRAAADSAHYQSFRLQTPVSLSEQQVISSALEQRGLREAEDGKRGDVQVTAELRREQRWYPVADSAGLWYGRGFGHRHYWPGDYYGLYGSVPLWRNAARDVLVLRLALTDSQSGALIWSGSGEAFSSGNDLNALRQAAQRALAHFPAD